MTLRRFIFTWSNTVVFTVDEPEVELTDISAWLFGDTTASNGIVYLPANVAPAKSYTIKKIDASNNIMTVIPDDANCLIDGVASIDVDTAMSCIKSTDGNYYTIVNGSGGGGGSSNVDLSGYPNNAQLSGNLTHYELITDLTANYPNNSQLSSNLTYFVNTAQLTSNLTNYPNTAQLASNLANYPNNSQLSSNLTYFVNTSQLASNLTNYPNTAQLASNLANYPNTAQLASNLSNYPNTVQLSGNLGWYPNNTQLTNNLANYQTTAGLAANVLILVANNTTYVGAVTAANVVSNAQLQANLGNYPNTINLTNNLSNYQTTAGLSANVATLTANNTSYVGAVTAVNVVSNAQLSANLGNYQTSAGLAANVATLTANNTSYVGAVTAVNVVSNAQLAGNLALYTNTLNMTTTLGNYQTTAGLSGNVATLTANNTSYVGAVTAVNVVSNAQLSGNLGWYPNNTQLTNNLANYQTTAGLSANVLTLTANNANYVKANSGIVSNSSGVFAAAANGLSLTAAGLNVVQSNGIVSNTTGLFLIANTGITINATGIFAPTAAGGTVTNVAPANGIMTSPNPITGAGTVAVTAGVGVVVNTSGVNVLANSGIVANSTGVFVLANTGITVNSSGVFGTSAPVGNSGIVSNATGIFANLGTGLSFVTGAITVSDVSGLTANNATYLGGVVSTSYINTSGNYVISGNHSYGNSTANVFINSTAIILGNSSVNATMNTTTFSGIALTANNATNLGGVAAASYQQTGAALTNNVATMSANNSAYLGGVAAASYQQTGAPLTNNVATMTANNATYLGGVVSTSYINIAGNYTITGNHTYGNATVFVYVNSSAINVGTINSTAVGLTVTNTLLTIGNSSVNATINSTTFSGISLTANNATYLGGVAAASYQQTGAALTNNVATMSANNSSYLGTVAAASYQQTGAPLVNNVATMSANNSSYLGTVAAASYQQTGAPLTNNVATMTANNATYLGGVVSTSYINISGNYVTTGNLTFGNSTVNNVINSTALTVGAINTTAIGAIYANNYLMIGNSSVNGTINASTLSTSGPNYTVISTTTTAVPLTVKGAASATANLFQVSNSGSVIFAVNSLGVLVGNGFGLTSISASITANSGIVSNATGVFANVGNGMLLSSGAIQLQGNTGITVNTSGIFASGSVGGQIYLMDSITGSFNGVTTTFNLLSGAAPIVPAANQYLHVVLSGVVQTPGSAYSISGNSITFATPPLTGDTCSMVVFGTVNPATPGTLTLLDGIAGSFNGATTTFNLASGGNAVTPGSPTNLIVVLGGVVQDPSSAYTVSGTQITFTAAPATNEPCSIRLIGSPATGSVAGSNSQVIFNDSGAYAGDANHTWDKNADLLTVGNSTVNVQTNSTTFYIRNAAGNVFVSNTYLTGNGYGLTSLTMPTNVLYGNVADQTVSGGAWVTCYNLGVSNSIGSNNITVDPGLAPLQYLINNVATTTITAPAHDGSCQILLYNGASAGTLAFASFTANSANGGDTYATTSGQKFFINISRINGNSTYSIWAGQ